MNKFATEILFSKTDIIVTNRLLLRKIRLSDAKDMYEYASDNDVVKYLTWGPHPDVAYTKRYLATVERAYKNKTFFDWAVVLKVNHKMIGTCGFTSFDYSNCMCEIGYVLNPRYRGYGIMPEAVNAVIEFAFDKLGAKTVEAKFMKGNDASLRVMEKCRMSFEGYTPSAIMCRGERIDVGRCTLNVADYRTELNL